MPTYDFRDTKTDEIFEKFISISNKEKYLKDNPHIKQVYTKVPGIISGTNMSMNVDNHGFKEVLTATMCLFCIFLISHQH